MPITFSQTTKKQSIIIKRQPKSPQTMTKPAIISPSASTYKKTSTMLNKT